MRESRFWYTNTSCLEIAEEIKAANSLDLIDYIGWQTEDKDIATKAFSEFCNRYDQVVIKMAEIKCSKWNYNEVVALDIANCTFARVWKYPSYNHEKSRTKNIDKGIRLWLGRIVYTQLVNYHKKGDCAEPINESDLSIIYTFDDFVNKSTEDVNQKELLHNRLSIIEDLFLQLSDKHRIIYLTYKLYTHEGNNIPRDISKKLQDELGLVPASIRKYKEQANKLVENYLTNINGKEE